MAINGIFFSKIWSDDKILNRESCSALKMPLETPEAILFAKPMQGYAIDYYNPSDRIMAQLVTPLKLRALIL